MRRTGPLLLVVSACLVAASPSVVSSATTTVPSTTVPSTTTLPVLCPPSGDGATTTIPLTGCVNPATTTTSSTTTSSLPIAVTTVPEGCSLPPTAQAVFVGTVASLDPVNAVFTVNQLRAGSLDGYSANGSVQVRYGSDAKYLDVGEAYLVGVEQDSVTLRLTSTLRDRAELFGGAEVAGSQTRCPEHEAAARTLNIDGTAVATGMLDKLFEQPWRLAVALLVPPTLVLFALFALVWFRRGIRR